MWLSLFLPLLWSHGLNAKLQILPIKFTKHCHAAKSEYSQLSTLFSSTQCNWPILPADFSYRWMTLTMESNEQSVAKQPRHTTFSVEWSIQLTEKLGEHYGFGALRNGSCKIFQNLSGFPQECSDFLPQSKDKIRSTQNGPNVWMCKWRCKWVLSQWQLCDWLVPCAVWTLPLTQTQLGLTLYSLSNYEYAA